MDAIIFALKSGGIGLLSGIAVGFISKKVSKIMVFMIALAFILIQVAIYNGYISVDWLSWKDTAVEMAKRTKLPTASIQNIIMRNIPFSVAAIIGFIFGFKKG
ncbi:MAG: FUN14 domain-containing protein [Melioribacteraceae bacterium]|nr:FUN14 domain-containing protein [Melioribacteraceae bacterium]